MTHVRRAVGPFLVTILLLLPACSVPDVIRAVWAGTGHEERAVRVAKCESRFDPSARNGQYRGGFQMGASEWQRYGAGGNPHDAMANILAARRYWDVAGGWGPWECKG